MKSSVKIIVSDIEDITKFNQTINKFQGEAQLIKGRYKCDAKSLMGLLAIDTSSPTILEFDIKDRDEILKLVSDYIFK